jgi:hypothetical protein
MERYAHLVRNREPLVDNIIGFADGMKVKVQCSESDEDQSKFFNDYDGDTVINNVYCFSPEGKIFFAAINYPGSWHDSIVSIELQQFILQTDYAIAVDQGFPRSGRMYDRFLGPMSRRQRANIAPILQEHVEQQHALYISLRQAAEWGMRSLEGTFCRLKTRLTSDKKQRGRYLESITLLHNFRTVFMSINQIKAVFGLDYENVINIDGYDRIARYF